MDVEQHGDVFVVEPSPQVTNNGRSLPIQDAQDLDPRHLSKTCWQRQNGASLVFSCFV